MYANDENSGPVIKRDKRRSSILKIPKSPGSALDDIDPNTENVEETDRRSKKARRSSSRRVSFAEKCQVKEIPNKVSEKMNHDDFAINEENAVPPSFLNLESTRDNSMYRQPAQTLAGLPSLLTSPIQESPQTPGLPQFQPDDSDDQLDMTFCQSGVNVQNQSLQAMEMTKNYEGWELEQSTIFTSKYSVADKDDEQLDFTRTHGAYIPDNQHNITRPQDIMEMTRNYEGWEFEQSTVLTRQVVTSKVEVSNHEAMPKLNALNFLEELKANKSRPNERLERRNSYEKFQTSRNVQSSIRDETSFNQLRTSGNPEPQHRRDILNNPTLAEAHSTTGPAVSAFRRTRSAQSPKRDGSRFLRQLEAKTNISSYQPQQRVTSYAPPSNSHHTTMRSPEKNDDLDFTQCRPGYNERFDDEDTTECQMEMTGNYQTWNKQQSYMVPLKRHGAEDYGTRHKRSREEDLEFTCHQAGNIETPRLQTVDEDITVNMEMTRNYENWEHEKSMNMDLTQVHTPRNNNNLHFISNVTSYNSCDVDGANEMEMTRNYGNLEQEKCCIVSPPSKTPRNENYLQVASKPSPEKDDSLDFSCCQAGKIETSKLRVYDEDITADQNREQQKSITEARTPRNTNNFVQKVSKEISNVFPNHLRQNPDRSEMTDSSRQVEIPGTQRSMSIANASRQDEPSRNQASLISVSRQNQKSPSTMDVKRHEETCIPKINTPRREDKHQKSMVNASMCIGTPGGTTSLITSKNPLEISACETSMVKAVPRASSSKITMDKNFQRFEIKMPTSRISKVPIVKPEEKRLIVKHDEKPAASDVNIVNEDPSTARDQDGTASTASMPLTSHVDDVKNEPKEIETSPMPEQENAHSETSINMSSRSIESDPNEMTITTAKTEHIEGQIDRKNYIPENKTVEIIPQEPYTLRQFMLDADINFGAKMIKRRSETPMILACDIPKELKDKIYSRCLSEAKYQIMEDFAQQLQKDIAENEKLFAAKERELDTKNPPVFAKLKEVLGTENEDSVVDILKQLKKTSVTRSKRLWYTRKKKMRKNILAALQEQEKKLLSDLAILNQHRNDLDEDISMLNKVETDLDKQLQELDANLESDEKEWSKYIEDIAELQHNLETLELELKAKEEERTNLSSLTESLKREIVEQREKTTEIESAVEKLAQEKKLRESKDEEMRKFLPCQTALQEWILEEYDNTELKFTFLGRTLDLDVSFEDEDEEKIKNIQLSSQISADSIPLAILGHQLVMEKFAHYDYLTMYPTRKKLPQLLHQVSLACIRVRILLETITEFSVNHIVSVNDKVLTVEFSSLPKFMKFILNFDLSKLVTDGDIPFTVVRKIGNTSAEAISEQLKKLPSTVMYFSKILRFADEMMK